MSSKAPYGALCVVCRGNISKGDRIRLYGGFWRHPACKPGKTEEQA